MQRLNPPPGVILWVLWVLIAVALWMLSGCTSLATMERREGFNQQWSGFARLPSSPDLYHETEIKVKVVVVGDPAQTGYPGAAGTYSHPEGIIRIVGKVVNGKIVLCEAVLGHEIGHALQYQDGGFANPDKYEEYGY
jgi:hypothetical protein